MYYLGSLAGVGPGPCPASIGGNCADLIAPVVLGSVTADASGIATFPLVVPGTLATGTDVHLQSLVIRGLSGANSILSTPVSTVLGGGVGADIVDDFVHFPAAADVLFVVDDSCSMYDEQVALASSFPVMIDTILDQGLDFHVGVVSTDMANPTKQGLLQPSLSGSLWIDPSDPNPEISFLEMASLGTNGSATERGLAAVDAALFVHGSAGNLGFRRVTAQLAVVVLSDEDDQSPELTTTYADALSAEAFYNGDVSFSSIVEPPIGGCNFYGVGQRYLDVTSQVGGIEASICDSDYSPALTTLTQTLWTSVPYSLSSIPDPATIEVTSFEGGTATILAPTDWVYDAAQNTVRFTSSYAPPSGTDIEVAYTEL